MIIITVTLKQINGSFFSTDELEENAIYDINLAKELKRINLLIEEKIEDSDKLRSLIKEWQTKINHLDCSEEYHNNPRGVDGIVDETNSDKRGGGDLMHQIKNAKIRLQVLTNNVVNLERIFDEKVKEYEDKLKQCP